MIKAMIAAYRKHSVYRATYKELSRLSTKELMDIGIDPSQIETIARESAYGDVFEKQKDTGSFSSLFNSRTEKEKIEKYLADSANLVDLENRLKNVDRGLAPWQMQARNFSKVWSTS
jgi:uncharacterized protein YjiS (DUF1127 family)